ncbi:MAG: sensor histidine kinase [Alphaproteobacteria bacterium]|nr:MAG: sensor histidine kinase [Alphaproteobacteria bacterium]
MRIQESWGARQIHSGPLPVLQSLIDAMLSNIAVLDIGGSIILVNRAWRNFARRNGLAAADAGVGLNYLEVCTNAAPQCPEAEECRLGLGQVIDGTTELFRQRYEMPVGGAPCHFVMTATNLPVEGERRILVSHEDVTLLIQAQQEVREGAIRLLEGQERERRHIAREMHDSLCQELSAIKLLCAQLRGAGPDHRGGILAEADEVTDRAIRMVRTFSFVLHSDDSGESDTVATMEHFAKGFSRRTGLEMSFTARVRRPTLLASLQVPLLRILQESLTNVHRHAGATAARVVLREIRGAIVLSVEDDGCGFDPLAAPGTGSGGVGIASMRARARELGGRLIFDSTPAGSRLVAILPL